MNDDETLEQRLDDLLIDTTAIRKLLDEENRKRDVRIAETKKASRRALIAAAFGLAAAVIGVGVGVYASLQARDARNDLATANAASAAARRGSCVQYNLQQQRDIDASKAEIRVLTGRAKPGNEAAVLMFLADYDRSVVEHHPLRDCSSAGIARYLRSPTP